MIDYAQNLLYRGKIFNSQREGEGELRKFKTPE